MLPTILLCISKLSRWKTEFKTVVITKFQKKQTKKTIPSFPDFDDRYANSTLPDIALLRDMAWAITNSVGSMCVQKKNSNQLVLGQRS